MDSNQYKAYTKNEILNLNGLVNNSKDCDAQLENIKNILGMIDDQKNLSWLISIFLSLCTWSTKSRRINTLLESLDSAVNELKTNLANLKLTSLDLGDLNIGSIDCSELDSKIDKINQSFPSCESSTLLNFSQMNVAINDAAQLLHDLRTPWHALILQIETASNFVYAVLYGSTTKLEVVFPQMHSTCKVDLIQSLAKFNPFIPVSFNEYIKKILENLDEIDKPYPLFQGFCAYYAEDYYMAGKIWFDAELHLFITKFLENYDGAEIFVGQTYSLLNNHLAAIQSLSKINDPGQSIFLDLKNSVDTHLRGLKLPQGENSDPNDCLNVLERVNQRVDIAKIVKDNYPQMADALFKDALEILLEASYHGNSLEASRRYSIYLDSGLGEKEAAMKVAGDIWGCMDSAQHPLDETSTTLNDIGNWYMKAEEWKLAGDFFMKAHKLCDDNSSIYSDPAYSAYRRHERSLNSELEKAEFWYSIDEWDKARSFYVRLKMFNMAAKCAIEESNAVKCIEFLSLNESEPSSN